MPGNMPETDRISQSSSLSIKNRARKTQFANGYSQRQADGINSRVEVWTVLWENITETEKDNIVTELDTVGGHDYLYWQFQGVGAIKKFIVTDGYTISTLSGDIYSISTTIEQVFDI